MNIFCWFRENKFYIRMQATEHILLKKNVEFHEGILKKTQDFDFHNSFVQTFQNE